MKITKSQLKQIIKEELENVLSEQEDPFMPLGYVGFYSGSPPKEAEYVFTRKCEADWDSEPIYAPRGAGKWHTLGSGQADIGELTEIAKQILKDPMKASQIVAVKVPSDPNITSVKVHSYEYVTKKGYPPNCGG